MRFGGRSRLDLLESDAVLAQHRTDARWRIDGLESACRELIRKIKQLGKVAGLVALRLEIKRSGVIPVLLPLGHHRGPEHPGGGVVTVPAGEIPALQALVTRHTVLTPDKGHRTGTACVLEVVLFLQPARGEDGVPVRAKQQRVVLAHAPLAARQWPRGIAADPRGK